ncbi:MAG: hypothetical protein Q4G60_04480 [bacterium]|nr:hypothetical protein [bacterium]
MQIQNICKETNTNIAAVQNCFDDIVGFLEKDVAKQFQTFSDTAEVLSDILHTNQESTEKIITIVQDFQHY